MTLWPTLVLCGVCVYLAGVLSGWTLHWLLCWWADATDPLGCGGREGDR